MRKFNLSAHFICIIMLLAIFSILSSESFGQRLQKDERFAMYNPTYHFYPSGDPTGLFYYEGEYYNNWGVAFSTDFVHWKYTPQRERSNRIALQLRDSTLTTEVRDSLQRSRVRLGGSGTIVVDRNNSSDLGVDGRPPLIAFYHNELQPARTQVIGMSYSLDGATSWTRYEKYPVLSIDSREFRDPKVFWHEGTGKWVMTIGWAEIPKIQFYNSSNLIDWEFMSEFGPWGATNGVWECADIFPISVDGDPENTKWVLVISVQPFNGQYYLGHFDGQRFVLDDEFRELLTFDKFTAGGDLVFDFECGIDAWDMEGDAFRQSPASQGLYRQGAIMGKEGSFFINSFNNEWAGTGKITSPPFTITRDYLNFKIGGGYAPGELGMSLLVDGKAVRSETGKNSNNLQWSGWDVSEFRGRSARLEIFDHATEGFASIHVDQVMLSDQKTITDMEKSMWIDYGPDFFAVRAWNNYAPDEKRTIWTGWMSSWRYVGEEPMGRIQSIPREVKLRTFPEGVRLVQLPIEELQSLRNKTYTASEATFEGLWTPKRLRPAKNSYELIVEFENISAHDFGVKLCVGNDQKTTVGYDVDSEEFYVDRRESGYDEFSAVFPKINRGPLKNRDNGLRLHIFVDNCSVEAFANDGEMVISSKIYPDSSSVGIEFFSARGEVKVKSATLYELDKIDLHP